VDTTFKPQLDSVSAAERPAAADLLAVATDVYVWKLLRRDRGLTRDKTEQRMRVLAQAIVDQLSTPEGDDRT
jgi:hypothetical protein